MPLDEATRRFAFLLQRDLRRLVEREGSRTDRGEDVVYDSVSRMATWETRRGDVIGRWYGEILATYDRRDRILHWAWAGKAPTATTTHADVVFREGQSRGVPQLTMSVVADLDDEDAATLARLAALVARAEGVHLREKEGTTEYIGLFDTPRPRDSGAHARDSSKFSVPPPSAPAQRTSTPPAVPRAAYRSLPPITEIYEPRTGHHGSEERVDVAPRRRSDRPRDDAPKRAPIREPARGIFLPVANGVLALLARSTPGYKQGLFVIHVDEDEDYRKRRLILSLVSLDAAGFLRSIDPPSELVESAVRMVDADRADGNGAWRKLSARITPRPDGGATLNVDVI